MSSLIDFVQFHEVDLPARLRSGNARLAAHDVTEVGAIGFHQEGTDHSYTYVPVGDDIEIRRGTSDARTVVTIDLESFSGLVGDAETAPGLLYSDRVSCTAGSPMRFVRWEPALRAMFHGRPIYDPAAFELRSAGGDPLDPAASFTTSDDGAAMTEFLHSAGYLHVRGVFDADEIETMLEAAQRQQAAATPGDDRSWWGRNRSGDEVLSRVTHAGSDPDLRRLYDDHRLLDLVALSEFDLTARAGQADEGVMVLWKQPDMTEGLSDIPWHRDCGLGGHATMCPLLIATVCLTGGGPDSGELRMLPGSWRYSSPSIDTDDSDAPQGVALDVQPGDVTLHYSDIAHVSCPPSGRGPFRTSLLLAFVPDVETHALSKQSYNSALHRSSDGHVDHLRDVLEAKPTR